MSDEPNENAIPLPPPPPPPPPPPGLMAMPALSASRLGWFTSEFAICFIITIGFILQDAGVFPEGSLEGRILAAILAAAYSLSRALTKGAEAKAISAASTPARRTQLKSQSSR